MTTSALRWLVALAAFALLGCGPQAPPTKVLPTDNLAASEPAVRDALVAARAKFDAVAASRPDAFALASAWGELGMAYHAQDVHGQAEICYANAAALAPGEARWHFLRGVALRDAGRLDESVAELQVALGKAPDSASRIHFGQALVQAGRPEAAKPLFEEAAKDPAARAAAMAGLGRVALATGHPREAVDAFEEALRLWPTATRLHQPLAMAYRGMNNDAKAAEHLRLHVANGLEPGFPDPLVDKLRSLAVGARVHLARGVRAAAAGRFDLAEAAFRDAIKADPRNSEARSNLGVSLANQGRDAEARVAMEEAVSVDEKNANAQFGLALLYDRQGAERLARDHYERAVALDPSNLRARFFLADACMRAGESRAAVPLYKAVVEASPDDSVARVAYAMALVRERKWREARSALEDRFDASTSDVPRANALARLLAAAPDDKVRDGQRALALSKPMFETTHAPVVGITYAMAMAEVGDFEHAASLQRATLGVANRLNAPDVLPFVQHNLALFEQRKPAREPWPAKDPGFSPRRVQGTPASPPSASH